MEYKNIFEQIKLIESNSGTVSYLNDSLNNKVEKLFNSSMLQNIENAICFEAQCILYVCRSYCLLAGKDLVGRMQNSKALIVLMEANPQKLKYYLTKYRTAINQYLNSSYAIKDFSEFEVYIQKLTESTAKSGPYLKARNFIMVMNLKLNKNFALNDIDANKLLIRDFENELQLHENVMPVDSFGVLYINCIASFFYLEEYKLALVYVNKILNNLDESVKRTFVTIAKCINLIIHFELKNTILLNSLLKIYSSEKPIDSNEWKILDFINSVIKNLLNYKLITSKHKQNIKESYAELIKIKEVNNIIADSYLDKWLQQRLIFLKEA